jgi:hypothetical protein
LEHVFKSQRKQIPFLIRELVVARRDERTNASEHVLVSAALLREFRGKYQGFSSAAHFYPSRRSARVNDAANVRRRRTTSISRRVLVLVCVSPLERRRKRRRALFARLRLWSRIRAARR